MQPWTSCYELRAHSLIQRLAALKSRYQIKNPSKLINAILSKFGLEQNRCSSRDKPLLKNLRVINVDIDGSMHDVAKKLFEADEPGSEFVTADARRYIRNTDQVFDYIFVDAIGSEIFISSELSSVEFVRELKSKLKANGMLQMNILSAPGEALEKTIAANFKTQFRYVYESQVSNGNVFSNTFFDSKRSRNLIR